MEIAKNTGNLAKHISPAPIARVKIGAGYADLLPGSVIRGVTPFHDRLVGLGLFTMRLRIRLSRLFGGRLGPRGMCLVHVYNEQALRALPGVVVGEEA